MKGQEFDFYLLALQHTGMFCCENPKKCNDKRHDSTNSSTAASSSLAVHGLWPMNLYKAQSPIYCASEDFDPPRPLSGREKHEWKKHGSCSGLARDMYFLEEKRLATSEPTVKHVRSVVDNSVGVAISTDSLIAAGGDQMKSVAIKSTEACRLQEISICFSRSADGTVGPAAPCPVSVLRGSRNSAVSKFKCTKVYTGESCAALTSAMKDVLRQKQTGTFKDLPAPK